MPATQHQLNISVVLDVPSNSVGDLDESQVSFTVDKPTIRASSGNPNHHLTFNLFGTFNDGVAIPAHYLQLIQADGVSWYTNALEEDVNPDIRNDPNKRAAFENWLNNHEPTVQAGGTTATVEFNRNQLRTFMDQGMTVRLAFDVHIQVARNEPSGWLFMHHDPEVDIEMDA
jgi:hypothetical protein